MSAQRSRDDAGARGEAIAPPPAADDSTARRAARRPAQAPPRRIEPLPPDAFLEGPAAEATLRSWLRAAREAAGGDVEVVRQTLTRTIALLDEALTRQVNEIIHHPRFQELESGWRGLRYLVDRADVDRERTVRVRVLNARWRELARDVERSIEFDQTTLFQKIYEEEFGLAGGEPFGVLVGNYEIRHKPSPDHPIDDLEVLRSISEAAAAAFAPFLCGAHPSLLGLDSFSPIERQPDLERLFQGADYVKWHSLRASEDSRFLGVTAPRILMRLPYGRTEAVAVQCACRACGLEIRAPQTGQCPHCGWQYAPDDPAALHTRRLGFRYHEDVEGPDRARYLWGNAAFALAGVLIRAFHDSAWLADIRGFDRNYDHGGLVTGLPVHSFGYDEPGVAPKTSTDVVIDDLQEKTFAEQGLIPLSHCHDTEFSVFYSNRSVHRPRVYDEEQATINARISSMLQYTLCISRFAHYLKVQARELIGSAQEPAQLGGRLRDWINEYVTQDDMAAPDVKAKYPLREADVQVRAMPGRPGAYQLQMRLWPHYQLDDLLVSVRFVTRVDGKAG